MELYQLKIVFEYMLQVVMIIDQDYVFVNVNEVYCVVVQCICEDMIGCYVFDVFFDMFEWIKIIKIIFNILLNGEIM